MTALTDLTIIEAKKLLKKGDISSVDLVKDHLDCIQEKKDLNAYTHVTREIALARAEKSDEKYKLGNEGVIEGIPIAVKDLFCTEGIESTSCSNILKGFKPVYESHVTSLLAINGGVMIGKTNMDEFAMGSANINTPYGAAINPHKASDSDADLVAGGSSGGSAVAVAANTAMASLGSDTGGSIRQPASFTGVFGIKPTYGRCSRWGMIAFASSLDQAGVFAKSSKDAALVLESISGYDARDSTSVNADITSFLEATKGEIKGVKIGIPKEYRSESVEKDIKDLWDKAADALQNAGAEIVPITLPHTEFALSAYYVIAPAEASSNLARYDGVRYGNRVMPEGCSLDEMYKATRYDGFGDEVKRRIMIGTYVLSAGYYDAYYTKAQRVRTLVTKDFREAFEKVDVILTPSTPNCAFKIDSDFDPVKMYMNDILTVPTSLAGLPAISVPSGISSNGLPMGLQIIGKAFDEGSILNVAQALEDLL